MIQDNAKINERKATNTWRNLRPTAVDGFLLLLNKSAPLIRRYKLDYAQVKVDNLCNPVCITDFNYHPYDSAAIEGILIND